MQVNVVLRSYCGQRYCSLITDSWIVFHEQLAKWHTLVHERVTFKSDGKRARADLVEVRCVEIKFLQDEIVPQQTGKHFGMVCLKARLAEAERARAFAQLKIVTTQVGKGAGVMQLEQDFAHFPKESWQLRASTHIKRSESGVALECLCEAFAVDYKVTGAEVKRAQSALGAHHQINELPSRLLPSGVASTLVSLPNCRLVKCNRVTRAQTPPLRIWRRTATNASMS